MSLILEALRKSEAERRRGQAPGLHSALPASAMSRTATRPVWPWVVTTFALLLTGILAAVLFLQRPTAHTPMTAAPSNHATVITEPAPTHSVPAVLAPATPDQVVVQPAPAAAPPLASKSSYAPAAKPQTPASTIASAPVPETAPVPAPETVSATPVDTPEATLAASTDAPRIASIADLDSSTRAALPPLKLTMHVWNTDPALRFVIVDGHRLGEGGKLDDAVIDTITRDGLILGWRDLHIAVGRP